MIAKIGLASDHAGYALKQHVKQYLKSKGWEYEDFGCLSEESCDYPDYAHALGKAVDEGRFSHVRDPHHHGAHRAV